MGRCQVRVRLHTYLKSITGSQPDDGNTSGVQDIRLETSLAGDNSMAIQLGMDTDSA